MGVVVEVCSHVVPSECLLIFVQVVTVPAAAVAAEAGGDGAVAGAVVAVAVVTMVVDTVVAAVEVMGVGEEVMEDVTGGELAYLT